MKEFKNELSKNEINNLDGFDQWQYFLLRALNVFEKKMVCSVKNLSPPDDQLSTLIEKAAIHPNFKKKSGEFVDHLLNLNASNRVTRNNCFSMTSSALLFLPLSKAGVLWNEKWTTLFVLEDTPAVWIKQLVEALPMEWRDNILWDLNCGIDIYQQFIELTPSARHITRWLQRIDKVREEGREPKLKTLNFEKNIYDLKTSNPIIAEGIKQFEQERGAHHLQLAVETGNIEKIKILLAQGVSAKAVTTESGNSSLHSVTEKTTPEILELLLAHGADLELQNANKHTPLLEWLYNFPREDVEQTCKNLLVLIEFILQKGAVLDWYQDTASTYASHSGYKPLQTLLESKKYYRSPLVRALKDGDLDKYNKLIASTMPLSFHANEVMQGIMEDVDVNLAVEIAKSCLPFIKDINRPCCQPRYTYLMAATWCNLPLMELLIDQGADINYSDANGRCALNNAFQRNNIDAVKLLIKHGANLSGPAGTTHLLNLIKKNKLALVELLIESKVEINRVVDKKTPLQAAIESGNIQIIHLLLAAKANPNLRSEGGDYPLVMAIKAGNCEAIHLLLTHDADSSLEIKKKSTIADLGKSSKKTGVAELFRLTAPQLKTYKPKKDGLVFANKRMLFETGVDQWTDVIHAQVKKVFGKMAIDSIKEEAGEIEYVDVLDLETNKGRYQLMTFNFGDGVLLSWDKTTVVGNIVQHGFEITKTMNADMKSQLCRMLNEANEVYGGVEQGVDFVK